MTDSVRVKHVSYTDKSMLMDDESADCLIRFAAVLGNAARAETVTLEAISGDGNVAAVTFLLNNATVLAVESATGGGSPPRNDEAVSWMRDQMDAIEHPPVALPASPSTESLLDPDAYR